MMKWGTPMTQETSILENYPWKSLVVDALPMLSVGLFSVVNCYIARGSLVFFGTNGSGNARHHWPQILSGQMPAYPAALCCMIKPKFWKPKGWFPHNRNAIRWHKSLVPRVFTSHTKTWCKPMFLNTCYFHHHLMTLIDGHPKFLQGCW